MKSPQLRRRLFKDDLASSASLPTDDECKYSRAVSARDKEAIHRAYKEAGIEITTEEFVQTGTLIDSIFEQEKECCKDPMELTDQNQLRSMDVQAISASVGVPYSRVSDDESKSIDLPPSTIYTNHTQSTRGTSPCSVLSNPHFHAFEDQNLRRQRVERIKSRLRSIEGCYRQNNSYISTEASNSCQSQSLWSSPLKKNSVDESDCGSTPSTQRILREAMIFFLSMFAIFMVYIVHRERQEHHLELEMNHLKFIEHTLMMKSDIKLSSQYAGGDNIREVDGKISFGQENNRWDQLIQNDCGNLNYKSDISSGHIEYGFEENDEGSYICRAINPTASFVNELETNPSHPLATYDASGHVRNVAEAFVPEGVEEETNAVAMRKFGHEKRNKYVVLGMFIDY